MCMIEQKATRLLLIIHLKTKTNLINHLFVGFLFAQITASTTTTTIIFINKHFCIILSTIYEVKINSDS